MRLPSGMTADEDIARDDTERSRTVEEWLPVESLFVSLIFGVLCECELCKLGMTVEVVTNEDVDMIDVWAEVVVDDNKDGMFPVMHISKKGGIPGTSSSRSLIEDAI